MVGIVAHSHVVPLLRAKSARVTALRSCSGRVLLFFALPDRTVSAMPRLSACGKRLTCVFLTRRQLRCHLSSHLHPTPRPPKENARTGLSKLCCVAGLVAGGCAGDVEYCKRDAQPARVMCQGLFSTVDSPRAGQQLGPPSSNQCTGHRGGIADTLVR